MRRFARVLVRAGGIMPLALGRLLRDPYLLPIRDWALPALLMLGAIVTLGLLARRWTPARTCCCATTAISITAPSPARLMVSGEETQPAWVLLHRSHSAGKLPRRPQD